MRVVTFFIQNLLGGVRWGAAASTNETVGDRGEVVDARRNHGYSAYTNSVVTILMSHHQPTAPTFLPKRGEWSYFSENYGSKQLNNIRGYEISKGILLLILIINIPIVYIIIRSLSCCCQTQCWYRAAEQYIDDEDKEFDSLVVLYTYYIIIYIVLLLLKCVLLLL